VHILWKSAKINSKETAIKLASGAGAQKMMETTLSVV
jgi:hypothetical protein